jgi:hypothetical protein
MSDEVIYCFKCNFKCVKGQIYKSAGRCPRCGTILDSNINTQAKAVGVANA